jgi:hypothetical protein
LYIEEYKGRLIKGGNIENNYEYYLISETQLSREVSYTSKLTIRRLSNKEFFMVENTLPQYQPPVVLTYTDEDILEELGPARTSGSAPCLTNHGGHCK